MQLKEIGFATNGKNFYSHTPCGVQPSIFMIHNSQSHFYSHTPCGVQLWYSIYIKRKTNFYSHTPCGVQRKSFSTFFFRSWFLLTHPLRGATHQWYSNTSTCNISTHTPLAGCNKVNRWHKKEISKFLLTHPLRGATTSGQIGALHWRFLLTHPLRGATQKRNRCLRIFSISTHTPLAGCNILDSGVGRLNINFYSHTPCGVQHII